MSIPAVLRRAIPILLLCALPVLEASADQAAPAVSTPRVGVLDAPCDALSPMPAQITEYMAAAAKAKAEGKVLPPPSPEKMAEGMVLYHAWERTRLTEDFAGHCRYEKENAALAPADKGRVLLFGDSITEFWQQKMPELFGPQFIDRGISGQTTSQMVIRFQQDVLALKPSVIQIMAGTNDIAGNTGPLRLAWTEQNITSMVELAKAHGIRVLLASVPPAKAFDWRPGIDPRAAIGELNAWLKQYAAAQCLTWVDYHAALVDADGSLKRAYTEDGVHPTRAGYEAMKPVLEQALASSPPRCPR